MKLKDYINAFPRRKRTKLRIKLAQLQGRAEVSVRSWANGNRRHPYTLQAIQITENFTKGKVSRHDLRPDIFGPPPGEKRGGNPVKRRGKKKSSRATGGKHG